MSCKLVLGIVLALVSVPMSQGQAAGVSSAAIAQMAPAKALEDLIGMFERQVTNAAMAMPADKYNFSPALLPIPGASFTGVRSFADEVKHVAQSNYLTASNIAGTDPAVDVKAIATLKTKDEILRALAGSFAAVHTAVDAITPATQNQAVDDIGVGPNQTRGSEAAWVAVHGFDHYGQMVEYLRMNGIVPPGNATPIVAKSK